MQAASDLTVITMKLDNLNNIYSVWRFNEYLRVTYVARGWLVVWDHRASPPQRYDIKETGDHATTCKRTAEQLQKLVIKRQLNP